MTESAFAVKNVSQFDRIHSAETVSGNAIWAAILSQWPVNDIFNVCSPANQNGSIPWEALEAYTADAKRLCYEKYCLVVEMFTHIPPVRISRVWNHTLALSLRVQVYSDDSTLRSSTSRL